MKRRTTCVAGLVSVSLLCVFSLMLPAEPGVIHFAIALLAASQVFLIGLISTPNDK